MNEIAVYYGRFFRLIHSIVDLEYFFPDQRIISINQAYDFAIRAIVVDSVINVEHNLFVLLIYINLYFFLRNFILLDVLFHKIQGFVRRSIVNVHYMVVFVILHKNGIEVSQVQFGSGVVIRGYNKAETQLVRVVFAKLVYRFEM